MDLPVVDLAPYLDAAAQRGGGGGGPDRRAEEDVAALCAVVSGSLRDTGAILVKDPRCSAEDNDRFLDMMERYFDRSEEFKRLQERPNLHYQENFCVGSIWSILVGVLFAKCLQYKPIKKESVVIMPAFGVQLETHFWSGKVNRRFIPIGKILKPILNECVTPVTCYWSLALILQDEDELMLVFRKLRPPVKILVPVWKALCADADYDGSSCSTDPHHN